MKCLALSFISFCVLTLLVYGQKVEKNNKVKVVHFYMEMIEIDALELATIMSEESSSRDHTAIRNKVFAMVKSGEAKLIENQSIVLDTDQVSKISNTEQYFYHKGYQAPAFIKIPKEKGMKDNQDDFRLSILPPYPLKFIARTVGLTMKLKTKIFEKRGQPVQIKIELDGELSSVVGTNKYASWKTKNTKIDVEKPIFSSLNFKSQQTLLDGKFLLASTHSAQDGGKENPAKKILMFIKADILGGKLSLAQQTAFSKNEGYPFNDDTENQSKQLSLYIEMLEIDAIDYAEIAVVRKTDKDFSATRNKLLKLVQQGKASILESNTTVFSDERALHTGVEFPYFEGGSKSDISKKEALKRYTPPFSPTGYETMKLGLYLWAQYSKQDSDEICIDSTLYYLTHERDIVQHEWKSPYANTVTKKPVFYTLHHHIIVTLDSGKFILLSTHTPFKTNGNKSNKKIIITAKPTLLNIGK